MMRPGQLASMVLSVTIAVVLICAALSAASDTWYEPNQIIAKFIPEVGMVSAETKDGLVSVGLPSLDAKMVQYGVCHIEQVFPYKRSELGHIYAFEFKVPSDAKTVARDFASSEYLLYAEPRYIHRTCDAPNDPNFQNQLQWYLYTLHAPEAWDSTHGDPATVIGLVDTGVDMDHPDLLANRWFNLGEDADHNGYFSNPDWNLIDDDGNGFVDDFFGWDFQGITGVQDNYPDEGGTLHGTHTAGVCCAVTDNGVANAGISWNCPFMTVKVSRDGEDTILRGYEGIQYAANNGAQVINLSWARADTASAFEQEVIDSAVAQGAILVAAAGNDEPGNAYAPPDTCPLMYPAAYEHVTAVAATDMSDRAASFTYYGTWIDICAPGNGIYSHLWYHSYGMRSSTSAACALVSGVAALVKVREPDMTSDQFTTRIQSTCDTISHLNPTYAGWLGAGRVNAHRAVANITSAAEPQMIDGNMPGGYVLSQNYPNPFNPNTTISYYLPAADLVELKIYNVRGQLVKTLISENQASGQHLVHWDGCDVRGQRATSGIYFYQLKTENWSEARKMVLMR